MLTKYVFLMIFIFSGLSRAETYKAQITDSTIGTLDVVVDFKVNLPSASAQPSKKTREYNLGGPTLYVCENKIQFEKALEAEIKVYNQNHELVATAVEDSTLPKNALGILELANVENTSECKDTDFSSNAKIQVMNGGFEYLLDLGEKFIRLTLLQKHNLSLPGTSQGIILSKPNGFQLINYSVADLLATSESNLTYKIGEKASPYRYVSFGVVILRK